MNFGKWNEKYEYAVERTPYAPTETYQLGADWLEECEWLVDFGCGLGWLRNYVSEERYYGVDGSVSPFADEVVDLATYRVETPGVFMRHVIEHCHDWQTVLDNALASFTERMALILFTPLAGETHNLGDDDDPPVPNYSFKLEDLTGRFIEYECEWGYVQRRTSVARGGVETVFYLWKTARCATCGENPAGSSGRCRRCDDSLREDREKTR